MPGVEGQSNPGVDAQLAALSQNVVEMDGSRSKMKKADQEALDDLIVERNQAIARAKGESATQADVEPIEVKPVNSESWQTGEQNR
jgi:hypothetical protein